MEQVQRRKTDNANLNHLAQGSDWWRNFVHTVMNLEFRNMQGIS
jgi:hypothetical protein